MRRILFITCCLTVWSCGGELADSNLPSCEVSFVVVAGEPVVAPATLVLDATVRSDFVGFRELSWRVEFAGQPVDYVIRDESDASSIEFDAAFPGPYDIVLDGVVGGEACRSGSRTLNTIAPNAAAKSYVLGIYPPGEPSYSRRITVYGGADNGVGTIDISTSRSQMVVADHEGAGLSAFVRFSTAGLVVAETASRADGSVDVGLGPGIYDIEVMPYDERVPYALGGFEVPGLPPLVLGPTPRTLAASLTDAGGPIADARIRVAASGGPGSVASTGPSGTTSVQVQPGSGLALEVVPPSAKVLPRLSATLSGAPGSVSVSYASMATRSLDLGVLDSGGSPLPNARVVFDGSFASAGTVDAGAGPTAMVGRFVGVWDADGAGQLGPFSVPEALYTVVLVTPGMTPTVMSLDLRAGQATPSSLQTQSAVVVTGQVVGPSGPVLGAKVRGRALGALAGVGADSPEATTDASGDFSLPLALGGQYELVAAKEGLPTGRVLQNVQESSTAMIYVPSAIAFIGRLARDSVAVAGASVVIFDEDSGLPIGVATSAEDGGFSISLPDPGAL